MPICQTASRQAAREVAGFGLLLMCILLVAGAKAVLADTIDPDCFWHLRVAEQLQHDGIGRLVDHLSFASIKTPWTPYSWLGELSMKWLWDNTGLLGVVITQAILEAAFFALIAVGCLQRKCEFHPLVCALIATAFAGYITLPYLSFRPVLVAIDLLALSSVLLLRDRQLDERTRAIWALPILAAVAVNFHFYGMFIAACVAALTVGAWIETLNAEGEREEARRRVRRYAILLGACILACCCTPMLPGMIESVFRYSMNDPLVRSKVIAEMQPMYSGTAKQILLGLVVITMIFAAVRRELRIGEWLWLLGMAVIFVRLGRACTIFMPIFAPVMCWSIPRLSDGVLAYRPTWVAAILLLLIGGVHVIRSVPAPDQQIDAWLNRHGPDMPGYPAEAADFVTQHVHKSTGHLINEFEWGGYLTWKLPDYQVLLDGRTQLYSPQFWEEAYLSDPATTSHFLTSVQADAAIVPANNSHYHDALVGLGWKQAYKDGRAEVLVPPTAMAQTSE